MAPCLQLLKTNSLRLSLVSNFIAQGWNGVVQLTLVPIYISVLGPEVYGLLGLFASIEALVMILDMGLTTALTREFTRFDKENQDALAPTLLKTSETIYWLSALTLATLLVFFSDYFAQEYVQREKLSAITVHNALLFLIAILTARIPISLYRGVLSGIHRQFLMNVISIVMTSIRGVGAILVLYLVSADIFALLIWLLFSFTLEVYTYHYFAWHELPSSTNKPRFKADVIRALLKFSTHMSLLAVLAVIIANADRLIMGKLLNLSEVGYYSVVKTLSNILMIAIAPVFMAIFPRFSALHHQANNQAVIILFHKSAKLVALCVSPIAAILIFYPTEILLLWTQSSSVAEKTATALQITVAAVLINCLLGIPYALQLASGKTWIPLVVTTLAVSIAVPVTYIAIVEYGIVGGAIGYMAFNIICLACSPVLTYCFILGEEVIKWLLFDVLSFVLPVFTIFMLLSQY